MNKKNNIKLNKKRVIKRFKISKNIKKINLNANSK